MFYLSQIYLKRFISDFFRFCECWFWLLKRIFLHIYPLYFQKSFFYRVFKKSNCQVRIILHTLLVWYWGKSQIFISFCLLISNWQDGIKLRWFGHRKWKLYFHRLHVQWKLDFHRLHVQFRPFGFLYLRFFGSAHLHRGWVNEFRCWTQGTALTSGKKCLQPCPFMPNILPAHLKW